VLAEGFLVKSGGYVGVGLGEGERDAIGHMRILAFFPGVMPRVCSREESEYISRDGQF
jgi:hypothetical protein